MSRSSIYAIVKVNEKEKWVLLEDLYEEGYSLPPLTMTNDVENVCMKVNKDYPGYRIFYIDTAGYRDEMVHDNGIFREFKLSL